MMFNGYGYRACRGGSYSALSIGTRRLLPKHRHRTTDIHYDCLKYGTMLVMISTLTNLSRVLNCADNETEITETGMKEVGMSDTM